MLYASVFSNKELDFPHVPFLDLEIFQIPTDICNHKMFRFVFYFLRYTLKTG